MRVTDMSIDARSLSVNTIPSVSIHIAKMCVSSVFSVSIKSIKLLSLTSNDLELVSGRF